MAVDDPGQDVGEVAVRLDAIELAGLDQGRDYRPVIGAAVRAGEQRVLTREREWADGAFDDVIVDLDAAVVEEQTEPGPAGQL
jgi:hypothetical protein